MSNDTKTYNDAVNLSPDEEDKEEAKGVPQISSISKAIEKERTKQYFVWSWGKNKSGELSHGGTANALIPRGVRCLKGKQIVWISSGAQHSAVVTGKGELLVCGSYLHGKLGLDNLTKTNVTTFQVVTALHGLKVKQVACGDYHTLCLLESGVVYTWGGSLHKKLGAREGGKDFRCPAQVVGLEGVKVAKVACGDFHSMALTVDGKVYSWGGGGSSFNKGQCGHGHNKDVEMPEMIKSLDNKNIVEIVCGGYHTLALTDSNELYAWGSGLYGECGFGAFNHTNAPKFVSISSRNTPNRSEGSDEPLRNAPNIHNDTNIIIKSIAAGGHHSMILTEDGSVYTFGYSAHGQLGLHTTVNQCLPQLVRDFSSIPIAQIAAGWHHSLALTTRGDLYAAGHGAWGQLGLGESDIMPNFIHVSPLGSKNVKKIFAGGDHSWVILDETNPERMEYILPSPLKPPASPQKSPPKAVTEGLTLEDYALLTVHKEALANSNYYLQVSFTDVAMCHRFVRFVVPEKGVEMVGIKVKAFIEELKAAELGVMYQQLQEDEDIMNPDTGLMESPGRTKSGQKYTLCVVADPTKNAPPILPLADPEKTSKEAESEGLLGVITNIREEVIKQQKGIDGKLSAWVKYFHRIVTPICSEPPIYFELRPLVFKEQ